MKHFPSFLYLKIYEKYTTRYILSHFIFTKSDVPFHSWDSPQRLLSGRSRSCRQYHGSSRTEDLQHKQNMSYIKNYCLCHEKGMEKAALYLSNVAAKSSAVIDVPTIRWWQLKMVGPPTYCHTVQRHLRSSMENKPGHLISYLMVYSLFTIFSRY